MWVRVTRRAFSVGLALLVLACPLGCGDGETRAETSELGRRTQQLEERIDSLSRKVKALEARSPVQVAQCEQIVHKIKQARIETTRKDPLQGTMPESAIKIANDALDDAEKLLSQPMK